MVLIGSNDEHKIDIGSLDQVGPESKIVGEHKVESKGRVLTLRGEDLPWKDGTWRHSAQATFEKHHRERRPCTSAKEGPKSEADEQYFVSTASGRQVHTHMGRLCNFTCTHDSDANDLVCGEDLLNE
jgi:hypothetical protein